MAAYILFRNRVLDADKIQEYLSKAVPTLAPYNPEVLVLDENSREIEGTTDFTGRS